MAIFKGNAKIVLYGMGVRLKELKRFVKIGVGG